ncbi:MAG: Gfo/Idh/MocA family oxidoreductase [Pirellulaceae bacterium]|nr:Gfo/Idh/MocA family oxidoreductase [Pirellulaceae bacterium]MCU0977996.1 Gfo/Idh/MocA family oxidoreductase [Pirellulaceae bacterium]
MSGRKLRLGVIGAGHLGTIHTRLVRSIDDVDLVGVSDPFPPARRRIAAEFQVETFEDHRPLLGRIDAAIVAAPTRDHYWIGMELAEAGVHLLVEKPLTASVAEADALIRAARTRNLVLQVGHVERFNPAFTAASRMSSPRYVEAVRASGYTGRSVDVGVVLDLMIHDIDLVLSLVGSELVEVDAVGTAVLGPHEDMAHAHLRFANGCLASLNASRTSYQSQRTMQIFGEQGYAGIDFATGSVKLIRPSDPVRRRQIDVLQLNAEERRQLPQRLFNDLLLVEDVQPEKRNAILDEQHDFVISIRSGQQPQVTGQHGRDALAAAERILQRIHEPQASDRRAPLTQGPHWDLAPQGVAQRIRKAG